MMYPDDGWQSFLWTVATVDEARRENSTLLNFESLVKLKESQLLFWLYGWHMSGDSGTSTGMTGSIETHALTGMTAKV